MTIELKCSGCGNTFQVPDEQAPGDSRCPACGAAMQPPAADTGWRLKSPDGTTYGPVPKRELDEWVKEDRVDQTFQLQASGSNAWQPAAEVYPELADTPDDFKLAEPPDAAKRPAAVTQPGTTTADTPPVDINPFAAPRAAGIGADAEGYLTDGVRHALRKTRPWVLFLSILGFIMTGLMIILGAGVIVASLAGGLAPAGIGLIYMLSSLIYGVPAYLLFKYARRIGAFLHHGNRGSLENAIRAQASFWRVTGIITAAVIVLYIAVFLLLAIGMSAGFR